MGCDIHMYLEYKKEKDTEFRSFGERVNPGRNYYIFGLLCRGVRSDNPLGIEERGLPDNIGYSANSDAYMFIDEDDSDGCATPEKAARWLANGSSQYKEGSDKFISNPDWHSHSWLTCAEYETQINTFLRHPEAGLYKEPEYDAVLAAMKSFTQNGYESRIVFWFDN